jgi:hypothetical protein
VDIFGNCEFVDGHLLVEYNGYRVIVVVDDADFNNYHAKYWRDRFPDRQVTSDNILGILCDKALDAQISSLLTHSTALDAKISREEVMGTRRAPTPVELNIRGTRRAKH